MSSEFVINGFQVYHGFLSGYLNISKEKDYINRINVFPVPDGDTGSNMIHTFKTIATRLESRRSVKKVIDHIADLSLEGARGNSGIIISQYLNGLSRHTENKNELTCSDFGRVVNKAVWDAYDAMEDAKEGTILSVIRAWAETIYAESTKSHSIDTLLKAGLLSAREALKRTTDQLQVLKENNVPDAGAWGFVSFLEGMGKAAREKISLRTAERELEKLQRSLSEAGFVKDHLPGNEITNRYCTEILLQLKTSERTNLKEELRQWGDSLIVSRGRGKQRVHIHTNYPAKVVETLKGSGIILQQKVEDMVRQEQIINKRAGKIGVVTDSIADIPMDLMDKYQVHMINIDLIWDDDIYLDRLTLSPEEFYRQQTERKTFPHTAAPPAARIERLLEYLMEYYEGLIVLPVAKRLSGTWQQFNIAARKYNQDKKRIEVIDTCLNSAAQGLLVYKTAMAAAENRELDDLKRMAEDLKSRIKIFVSVETFEYMVKGGRVSPLKGLLAKILNLKPIISLDSEGNGAAFDKSFSAKGLLRKITKLVNRINDEKGINEYVIVHAAARERAEKFSVLVERIVGKKPLYITDITPAVGMHSGKGAVAVGLIQNKD